MIPFIFSASLRPIGSKDSVQMKLCCLLLFLIGYQQGQTQALFNRLSPKQSGITFQNTLTDEKEHNILIYSNYYGGAGVGIGDFNNDGLQDIFFAGNLVADQLYMNKGDLQFEDQSQAAGIVHNEGWSSGVVLADVNNDGWLDIYVTRELYDEQPERRKNKLYLNQGKDPIAFKEVAADFQIDNPERTRHATFLDYDRDGYLDLFLLNQPPNPGNYSPMYGSDLKQEKWMPRLYRNLNGAGFEEVTKTAGLLRAGFTNSAIAADFNKDGWTDLYVTNDYEAPDWLYLNNQDGTFREVLKEQLKHISYYSMGVDAADINNDGWLDIMTLDMVAEDNFRLKANMGGMYPEAFWKLVAQGGHYQYMFNALHLNHGVLEGKNAYSDIAQLAGISNTDWSWTNLIADFDNDGLKDIYITNGLLRDIRNSDAAKAFPKYVQQVIDDYVKENPNAGTLSIFDILDLDKALSLIPSVPLANYAYKNNGNLTFSKTTKEWGFAEKTFSTGAAYGDLDNDGDLDLVVSNINAPAIIYENTTHTTGAHFLRIALQSPKPIIGTKITAKTKAATQFFEISNTRGMYSTSEAIAHFGLGKNTLADLTIEWPDGTIQTQKEVAADQLLTITYQPNQKEIPLASTTPPLFSPATAISFKHQENEFDDYEKQVLLPHKMSQFGPALAVGDLNGDGLEDVFIGGAKGQAGTLFIQNKQGQFTALPDPILQADAAYEDVAATFFDADNDGDLDVYVVSGGNAHPPQSKMYQDRLYINDDFGSLKKATTKLPKFRDSGSCVKPFDYDGDGDLDLFVGGRHIPWDYPSPAISRLLRNDNGQFTDITKTHAKEFIFLGMVTDAIWTDFNEDQQPDLIIVGEWMPITFFENNNGKLEKNSNFQLPNSNGWWYAIHGNDFDSDGDLDLVLGNLGQNYKYKASPSEPFEVHYADFDENGKKDIVLSYYNNGEQFPLRGKACSSEQIPALKEKFGSYNIFASANLEEVYTPTALQSALQLSATNFSTSYLENKGAGMYKSSPLPPLAQVSSTNTILSGDYNQDGHLDLLLAGNLFPAEIETPRNDGGIGLYLLGNGAGTFTPVAPMESGLLLNGDVKNMQMIETPTGKLLIVANNNGDIQTYKQ